MVIGLPARASCVALWCLFASNWAIGAEPESLVSVLEVLRAQGISLIYSSDLVKPDMVAPAPRTQDALANAREALAVYGLVLVPIGANRYIVTQAPRAPAPTTADDAREPLEATPPEVSVYASRYEISRAALAEPRILTGTDIELVPGARDDALRAVRTIPGLASNASTRPYIRGSFLDDLLVQFDGVPLADPFHLKNFQSLISAFDPEAVERLEIFSGGFPVRYGTKSGGVIDVEPRSLAQGYENTIGASFLAYDASSVGRSERWPIDWLITLRHSVSDVVLKPVNADEGEPAFSDSLGRVRWQLRDASAATLGWLLLDDRIDFASELGDQSALARYRDEYAWLAYDHSFGERLHSRTVLTGAWTERFRSGELDSPGVVVEKLQETRDFSSTELRSYWSYEANSRLSIDSSFEAAHARATLRYARRGAFSDEIAAAFGRAAGNTLLANAAPEVSTYALSLAARRRWSTLETEIGLRIDAQDYENTAFRTQWSPRLNLRYDVNRLWRLYGSWGRFTQAQRVDEWRMEEAQTQPDPSALAVHTILGVSYDDEDRWRASLELYRKRWTEVRPYFDNLLDTLSLLPDLGPDRIRLAPRTSDAAGLEVSVRTRLTRTLQASLGYATSRVVDDVGQADDVPRSWDQPHAVTGALAWNRGPWRGAALLGWHQGWPRTQLRASAPGSPLLFEVGPRNRNRWDNYVTLDLNGAWSRDLGGGVLTLWVDVTNAANGENECCAHLVSPAPGESAPLLTSNSWLPRVFNVGATWRLRHEP